MLTFMRNNYYRWEHPDEHTTQVCPPVMCPPVMCPPAHNYYYIPMTTQPR
jgi:hypothetical protein